MSVGLFILAWGLIISSASHSIAVFSPGKQFVGGCSSGTQPWEFTES